MTRADVPAVVRRRQVGRVVVSAALSAAALLAPACGSGGGGKAPTPADPGARVDPTASSGPAGAINRAKDAADAQEERDRQVEDTVP